MIPDPTDVVVIGAGQAGLSAAYHLQRRGLGFAVLDAFPVTVNGKVDHKALPPLDDSSLVSRLAYVPPTTPTQQLLATIWREILDCGEVGIEDSFFQLGGHSLLFTRLLVRIRKCFGVELPLRTAMESPTIQAHALAIADAQALGAASGSGAGHRTTSA